MFSEKIRSPTPSLAASSPVHSQRKHWLSPASPLAYHGERKNSLVVLRRLLHHLTFVHAGSEMPVCNLSRSVALFNVCRSVVSMCDFSTPARAPINGATATTLRGRVGSNNMATRPLCGASPTPPCRPGRKVDSTRQMPNRALSPWHVFPASALCCLRRPLRPRLLPAHATEGLDH